MSEDNVQTEPVREPAGEATTGAPFLVVLLRDWGLALAVVLGVVVVFNLLRT